MDARHGGRCVMSAIACGGRVIDSYAACDFLKTKCKIDVRPSDIIRNGPYRPVWDGCDNFYIPFLKGREIIEVKSGSWVESVEKEEMELLFKTGFLSCYF